MIKESSLPSKVLIWGGRSQARIDILLLESLGFTRNEIVIFDESVLYDSLDGVRLLRRVSDLRAEIDDVEFFVIAIGGEHGCARLNIGKELIRIGLYPMNLVSKDANIHPTAKIGVGIQIMQGAQIAPYAEVGDFTIVNTNATLDHESRIGPGVHLMGNSAIAGRVEINQSSTIGTNATVLPDVFICPKVYVGAGAVVTKSILESGVYIGVPAKRYSDFALKAINFDFAQLN